MPMFVDIAWFVKPSSLNGSLGVAEQALNSQGLGASPFFADGNWILAVGNNTAVSVTIVGVPQAGGTWIMISASADDPALAVQARDVIRGIIESTPAP
jgi:hypothetical protein